MQRVSAVGLRDAVVAAVYEGLMPEALYIWLVEKAKLNDQFEEINI